MTIRKRLLNRRQVLFLGTGASVAGLAGCFGSDDDSEEQPDGSTDDDDTPEETDDTDPTDELTDEEIAESVAEEFVSLLVDGEREQYNQLLHSKGNLERLESEDETFFGLDVTVTDSSVTERTEEQILVEIAVEVAQLDETVETTWELDIRPDDDIEWGLWDIETDELISEPALSPEAVVEEFVEALSVGQTETVERLLTEDGNVPETIRSEADEFEGIIQLEDTRVIDRNDGEARIDVAVVYDSPDGEVRDDWELIVAVVDGEWKIGWVR